MNQNLKKGVERESKVIAISRQSANTHQTSFTFEKRLTRFENCYTISHIDYKN